MEINNKIVVFGSSGMLGSAIVRKLKNDDYTNIIESTHKELDLRNQLDVAIFFQQQKPEYIFMAAAKVGGIMANNTYRGEFIYDNLAICTNVIHAAHENNVKKLLMLGSNCIYPKNAINPINEGFLLTGSLEPTNESYAIAKIAAIKMCESYRNQYGSNFITALPCNLYGEGDHYDLEKCHVMPALIRKFHEGKIKNTAVTIWGDGNAKREFLYVDDCADACVFLMENYNDAEPINIGSGSHWKISLLAQFIGRIIGFNGDIIYDTTKPSGTQNKLLDITKLYSLGWYHKFNLREGIEKTYNDIIENKIYEQWN